ncbi:MAG: HNH endonuclease [Paludibacteraceae bacterium]|nr:HNH endonuclease [Paludibacteraceae bacterium]
MKLVPYKGQDTHPNGVAFYVNNGQGGVIGVRVYPDGRKVAVNPKKNITDGTKFPTMKRGVQRYIDFRHAWGHCKAILASHAVYIAWRNKEIPAGMTIDHIDGVAQNNDFRNLRCISNDQNCRDGGFLRKLRNKGIKTTNIQRPYLLRYFDRMAKLKPAISKYRYRHLTRDQLHHILYDPDFSIPV